ncbi:MAG: methyltransferase domain-containing protein [Gammaproteobacteria bacterium]|nr:methyltransferase domain-containing protein [Gammaproteobacteria bacterium]
MQMNAQRQWFLEQGPWGETHQFEITHTVCEGKTHYQDYAIYQTREYGKMFVVGGFCQSSQHDEYIFHESLVHPAMIAHPRPRRVLVIGGGEGAALREVLRHPSVESVVLVDIDHQLVQKCTDYLPEWHQGAYHDTRVKMVVLTAAEYLNRTHATFDVIIVDLCLDLACESTRHLYERSTFEKMKQRLAPGGIMAMQAMELNGLTAEYASCHHIELRRKIAGIYRYLNSYHAFVPSLWSNRGFVIASDETYVNRYTARDVDHILAERRLDKLLRYYDGETHLHMFSLSKDVRKKLSLSETTA